MDVYKRMPNVIKTIICEYDPYKKIKYDLMLKQLVRGFKYKMENDIIKLCNIIDIKISNDINDVICPFLSDKEWRDYARVSIILDHEISKYGVERQPLQRLWDCHELLCNFNNRLDCIYYHINAH